MQYVRTDDDVDIAYRDIGSGRPLVLVHGLGIEGRIWEYQLAALSDQSRLIVPDLRGHGDSEKPAAGYSLERLADDIETLVTALDLENVVVVGWSLGGYIGAIYGARTPAALDRLVIVGSGVVHWGADPSVESTYSLDLKAAAAARREDRPAAERAFVDRIFTDDVGEDTEDWVFDLVMETPLYASLALFDALDGMSRDQWRDRLAAIEVPTDVFHGVHDDAASTHVAEHVVEDVVPAGTFVSFDDSGHLPFIEESERFNDCLRDVVT